MTIKANDTLGNTPMNLNKGVHSSRMSVLRCGHHTPSIARTMLLHPEGCRIYESLGDVKNSTVQDSFIPVDQKRSIKFRPAEHLHFFL